MSENGRDPDQDDLLVTDEYFDYLASEVDRPARTPNPKMVDLLRSTRGMITHTPDR